MAKLQQHEDSNNIQQLKMQLKERQFSRLYIFSGEETFLLHYYLEQMKKKLLDELSESFNYHKFTQENFSVAAFAEATENLPMMAENTFIWVDEIDIFKLNESERENMTAVLSDIPEYCSVVFTYIASEFKPDKRLKKLWDAVNSNGLIVNFEKQNQRDLIAWVTRHFAAEKKSISSDLCAYLIDITGGTMTALAGEISKICAYSGSDIIVKSDIDAVTEPVMEAVAFEMTNLMGQGQYGAALQKLHTLFKMQQEPVVILGAIGAHFRRLGVARTLQDHGKTYSDLMRLCGMSDYAAKKTMDMSRQFSAKFCSFAAELILETDNALKTSYDEPQRLLEVLILRLAQEARND